MKSDLNLIVKSAALMAGGVIASKLLGYFYNIFMARILTPAELGLFFIATAIIGLFVMVANIGIAESLTRFVAFYKAKEDIGRVKGSILSALRIHIFSSLIIGTMVFFSADWIAISIFSKPELGFLLKLLSFTLPFSVLASDLMTAMDGFKKIQYKIYIRRIIQIISKIALLVGLHLIGFSLTGAILAFIFSEITGFLFGFFFLEKRVFSIRTKTKTIFLEKELVKFSMPLFLTGIFSYLLAVFDIIILGFFAPPYDTGIYGTAVETAKIGLTPFEILIVLGIPIATTYFATEKFGKFKKIYHTLSRWILLVMLPLTILMIAFAEPIQVLLFGKAYANSANAMAILLLGYLFYTIMGPAQQTLIAAGKTKLTFINASVSGIIAVLCNIVLIPLFMQSNQAHLGAAISTAISYTIWGVLGLTEVYILFKIQPFTKIHAKTIFAGLASPAIAFFAVIYFLNYSVISAIATLLVFVPIYTIMFLLLKCFEKEDLEVLAAIERKTGFRIEFLRNIIKKFV